MSYITTYTGQHFDPTKPETEKINIRDIAHALSLTCRGNGHVKSFFSVAQHCINCAMEAEMRGLSRRVILACLLHDAGETYLSDVPRPLKPFMPEYLRVEEHLLDVIYNKFLGASLDEAEKKLVKQVDDDMLYYDLRELLNEASAGEAPKLLINLDYQVKPFEQVENIYLQLFEKWK